MLLVAVKVHGSHHHHHRHQEVEADHFNHHRNLSEKGKCGTASVTDQQLRANEVARKVRQIKLNRAGGAYQANSPKVIPVCFHVTNGAGWLSPDYISNWDLQRQLNALNTAFSGQSCCDPNLSWCNPGQCGPDTGIQFVMQYCWFGIWCTPGSQAWFGPLQWGACVKRTSRDVNLDRFPDAMAVYGEGNGEILNLYLGNLEETFGFATPPYLFLFDEIDAKADGVVVDILTRAGSNDPDYNQGDEMIHQVGYVFIPGPVERVTTIEAYHSLFFPHIAL